jgi:hypothetical protein
MACHYDLVAVTPAYGRNGKEVAGALKSALSSLESVRGGGGAADQVMRRYIDWATTQARLLQTYVTSQAVDELILTRSFYSLLDNSTGSLPRGFPLLDGEIDARRAALSRELEMLNQAIARWNDYLPLVVLDTNVYLHAPTDFTSLDLWAQVDEEAWHILILIASVDELDRAKHAPSQAIAHGTERVRDRARRTLGVFEDLLKFPDRVVKLPASSSVAEIVLDPPRHTRLTNTDDEIIDRAAAISAIAGRDVHLTTYDTGMLMRARGAGLLPHRPPPSS